MLIASLLKALAQHPPLWREHRQAIDEAEWPNEAKQVLACIDAAHGAGDKPLSGADIEARAAALYPGSSSKVALQAFVGAMRLADALSPESFAEWAGAQRERQRAAKLAAMALEAADGRVKFGELVAACSALAADDTAGKSAIVPCDLPALLSVAQTAGIEWRLPSLNASLGPLRPGDFGGIVARPETGKTSFVASEVTAMAAAGARVLWANNEEESSKVLLRAYSAALGAPQSDLLAAPDACQAAFAAACGDRLMVTSVEEGANRRAIEALCERFKPHVVVVDQMDKLTRIGHDAERYDLLLGGLWRWGRGLAQRRKCAVIAVTQASATAEGKKWLDMSDVADSKTSKAAELDFFIGIGKSNEKGKDGVRYLAILKNKLAGGPHCDPSRRHGQWGVKFRADISRYEDFQTTP